MLHTTLTSFSTGAASLSAVIEEMHEFGRVA